MTECVRGGGHAETVGGGDEACGGSRRSTAHGRLSGLVLCAIVGLAGLPGLSAAVTDKWDAKKTSKFNTGHDNGRIVRGTGSGGSCAAGDLCSLQIGSKDGFTGCPASNTGGCYRCVFVDSNDATKRKTSPATYDAALITKISCSTPPDWGSTYDAAKVELILQKYTGADVGARLDMDWEAMEVTGLSAAKYFLFLEEDIFTVQPTSINAYNNTVTVIGSGFSSSKNYRCVTFERATADSWANTRTIGFTGLSGFAFTVINHTMGVCIISTKFSARATKLSVMSLKESINTLDTVRDTPSAGFGSLQPAVEKITKPAGGGADIVYWKGLDITWFEAWTFTSMLSGLKTGGETMTISGAGFKQSPLRSYFCEYTYNDADNSGCDGQVTPDITARIGVQAILVNPLTLTCITPSWTYNLPIANTIVNVRADTKFTGELVQENLQATTFDFVSKPVWSADTPAEGTVFVEGVDCAMLNLTFKASGGSAPLRLTLDYTPLRPQPSKDFLQWDSTAPLLSDVLSKTDDLSTSYFVDSAVVDDIKSFGYCLGPMQYTLALPKTDLPEKTTASHVVYNKASQAFERKLDGLGISDNTGQPSNLMLTTLTSGNQVRGVLFWNVSRGWEGYGYKLCVTARHAAVSASTLTSDRFAKRCIYVVVPKCQKCYGPAEDLSIMAARYAGTWLDLWSLNLNLVNTSAVNMASDEVFNTPNDQVYVKAPDRQKVRLGVAYLIKAQDTLQSVGTRFGMSLRNLMQLNPDIFAQNQDAEMKDKLLCVLPSLSQYSTCSRLVEEPNPHHFEAKYRSPFFYDYDVTGAPIKTSNTRYPQPPLQLPQKTPP